MTRFALVAALTALCGALALLWVQSGEMNALRSDNDALRLFIAAQVASKTNITEDKESDAIIDNMPDLRIVPDRWLLPPSGGGGLY